ncbi:hypothetical protein [Microscilla marina]|uniref:Uncharacterized protein n=1 Tax=Microscilla marina ATCC 23134 TaxID=313606 RepID=A1ZQH5_MICM2|nr:hypothetical protein [Microscilla marina]EAY27347.1 hypothetical protein M23134_08299 [Microscilla marina ATCC 23134]
MLRFKKLFFVLVVLAVTNTVGHSQELLTTEDCDFKVMIVKDRYLFGKAFLKNEKIRRTSVKFTAKLVKIKVPYGKKSMLLAIKNTNCRAYCPRAKRIRQLHSGDERLLIRLLKKRKKSLLNQLNDCNF